MSGPVVMRILGLAGRHHVADPSERPKWLLEFDPERHGGRGHARFTEDKRRARRFRDHAEAWQVWHSVPRCAPVRADGKPNKPLTAYTVEFEPADG